MAGQPAHSPLLSIIIPNWNGAQHLPTCLDSLRRQTYPNLEVILNLNGYDALRRKDYATAISVFRLNVELFPESSNVYDSLGEAYMSDGQKESAIRHYKRSLELNPENENARTMLRDLEV